MKKINAVIYARFSSHKQNEESIEQQVSECEKYAADNGYNIIDIYSDEAVSARSDKRPNFQRMIRAAEHSDKFQTVIAYKSNRISRNMLQALQYETRLSAAGVNLVYVKEFYGDNAAGRYMLRSMMNLNQFYSENMSEDIKRAMVANAHECKVNARPRYGYKKGPDGKYAIDENTAPIVKEIFDKVCKGITVTDIKDDLNRRNIKTSYGSQFRTQTIQNLVQNDIYKGVYRWGDIVVPGGVPSIVNEDQWEMAQTSIRFRWRKPSDEWKEKEDYILSGKLFCGHCGSPMHGRSGTGKLGKRHAYYECYGVKKLSCHKKPVPKQYIEEKVIKYLVTDVLTDSVMEQIADETERQISELYDASVSEKKETERQIKANEKKMRRYLDLIGEGKFIDSMLVEMKAIEDEQKKLQELLNEYGTVKKVFERQNFIDFMKGLRLMADQPLFVRQILDVFVNAIYLYDDHIDIVMTYEPNKKKSISLKEKDGLLHKSQQSRCSQRAHKGVPLCKVANTEYFVRTIYL